MQLSPPSPLRQPQPSQGQQSLGTGSSQIQGLAQQLASTNLQAEQQAQLDLQRSVSAPVLTPLSNNPFQMQQFTAAILPMQNGTSVSSTAGVCPASGKTVGKGHMTQESVDFTTWQNQSGRHSPDAFASLSFRQM